VQAPADSATPAARSFETFAAVKTDWRRVLGRLARAYLRGDAEVSPRSAAICRQCDFGALCRVDELDLVASEEWPP
jgi:hypothetical protein